MSDTDGEALGRMIHTDTALSDTTLVMLTPLSERGESAMVTPNMFAAFLAKPVRHAHLFKTLVSVLGTESASLNDEQGHEELATNASEETGSPIRTYRARILLA